MTAMRDEAPACAVCGQHDDDHDGTEMHRYVAGTVSVAVMKRPLSRPAGLWASQRAAEMEADEDARYEEMWRHLDALHRAAYSDDPDIHPEDRTDARCILGGA